MKISSLFHLFDIDSFYLFQPFIFQDKMAPKGPFKLCTVNTAPERAKRLVGRVVEDVKEAYTIDYVQNAEREQFSHFAMFRVKPQEVRLRIEEEGITIGASKANTVRAGIEDVKAMCEKQKPDVLVRFRLFQLLFLFNDCS
jgi:hypothetical protein